MRRLVLLAVLIATPALAETGLSRYGQTPAIDLTQVPGQPMYGPYLNWAGKRAAQPISTLPSAGSAQPEPGPLTNSYLSRRLQPEAQVPMAMPAPQPSPAAPRYQAPVASTFVPQVPRGYQPLPPAMPAARALPESLYSPPPPPTAEVAPRAAMRQATAPTPPPAPAPLPPPQRLAQPVPAAPAPATIAQRLAAAPPPVATGPGPKLYSIHRGYGLQPDAIDPPETGTGYVLIGPADGGVQIPDLPQKPEPDPDKPF